MESNNDMAWLRDRLDKLDEKQDKMNEVLIKNTASLDEHMRRTALLETEVKPIKSHVQFMNNVAKLFSFVMGLALAAHTLGLLPF